MKIRLSLLLFAMCLFVNGQASINDYFGDPLDQHALVTGVIDNSPTGASSAWNFSSLTQTGTTTDTFTPPTPGELSSYPGTTQVLSTTDDMMETTQVFYRLTASTLFLTGASNPEFVIDYNTDNAEIGTYPLNFGDSANSDAIAGTIIAQGQSANYTGTITTEVDAYGTLSFEVVGLGSYSGSVTRVVVSQNISFTAGGIFPGTASVINYNYYKDSDGALVFRTSDGNVSVPGLGINDSFSIAEGLITNTLSIESVAVAKAVQLYPNPVENRLNLQINKGIVIQSMRIVDSHGRVVLMSTDGNQSSLDLSQLSSGFYTVLIDTDTGVIPKKIVKR